MPTNSDLYVKLSEQFPDEMHKTVRKGGSNLEYIPVSEIINRLNKVIGVDSWSFEVVRIDRDHLDPDYVVAQVRLTVMFPSDNPNYANKFISRDGFGGQKINRTKAGDIVDLGDDFKGAVSDALKKAATTIGVGLYLSRDEDAMETEAAQDAAPAAAPEAAKPVAAKPNADPEIDAAWTDFLSKSKALDADGKAALAVYWKEYSGGKPKPTRETASLEDLEALATEALRLTFGGDFETE